VVQNRSRNEGKSFQKLEKTITFGNTPKLFGMDFSPFQQHYGWKMIDNKQFKLIKKFEH
jgi:hypothetical protein